MCIFLPPQYLSLKGTFWNVKNLAPKPTHIHYVGPGSTDAEWLEDALPTGSVLQEPVTSALERLGGHVHQQDPVGQHREVRVRKMGVLYPV
jgi:hypothetical protein